MQSNIIFTAENSLVTATKNCASGRQEQTETGTNDKFFTPQVVGKYDG